MLEIIVLVSIIVLLPQIHGQILWVALAILVIIPGTYATWSGAPFVPTPKKILDRMVRLAGIRPGERVYDLGCGDGRLVFAAAKRQAKAVGFELSVPTFLYAKLLSLFHPRACIRFRDFWSQDYRDADVIFCYLLTDTMQTFKRKVWPQVKTGCRVVSHSFKMADVEPTVRETSVVMYVK